MHLFDAHQHPVMLPVDRQEMTLAVEVSGAWKTKALFFHDLLTETNFGLTPQPNLDSWWRVIVGKMIDEKPAMLVSILATHAQSRGDGISSTWSINLMWSGYLTAVHWRRESATQSTETMFAGNKIFVADEGQKAAAVRHKKRKRRRTVFGGDPVLEFPLLTFTPRNDMSSTCGNVSESENPPQAPSRETSPPSLPPSQTLLWGPFGGRGYQGHFPPLPAQGAWEAPQIGTQVGSVEQQIKARVQKEIDLVMSLQREPGKTMTAPLAYKDTDQPTLFQGHLSMDIRLPSPFRSDNPGSSSQEEKSFHHVRHPEDTRTHACSFYGCTKRFRKRTSLEKHKRRFRHSQIHDHRASGAELGAALVSSRPRARTELRGHHIPVPGG
jgi:hypothetical protein